MVRDKLGNNKVYVVCTIFLSSFLITDFKDEKEAERRTFLPSFFNNLQPKVRIRMYTVVLIAVHRH
jgi:hypothetical protein